MRSLALIIVALTAVACQAPQAPADGRFSTRIFEDIPTPKDAQYKDRNWESFSYQGDTWRAGRFTFFAESSEDRLLSFFSRTMTDPTYGWTLAGTDRRRQGSSKLTFTKSGDMCTVDIDAHGSSGREFDIVIRVNHRR